jgi:hypothetical protein
MADGALDLLRCAVVALFGSGLQAAQLARDPEST